MRWDILRAAEGQHGFSPFDFYGFGFAPPVGFSPYSGRFWSTATAHMQETLEAGSGHLFDIHAKHELKPQNDDTGWGGMLSESKHRPKPGSCDTPDKQKPAAVQARCALAIDLSNIIGCHARVAASLAEQRLDARLLPKL